MIRNWLCFSPTDGHIYCSTCRLMCPDASKSRTMFISGGFCNWKHALERLTGHEQGKQHIEAAVSFNHRSMVAGRIDTKMARQVQELELSQFAKFTKVYHEQEPEDITTELFLHKLIIDKSVQDTFPNVEIALRIYLVLMSSNCSGERSFSKPKLIKNRLRTSIGQERLTNLSIMSIESDVMHDMKFNEIIDEFAVKKARKVAVTVMN